MAFDKDKIIEEIKNSGYGLEINSALSLNKNEWQTTVNSRYYDSEIKGFREIDIVALRENKKIKGVEDCLVIECKKSEKNPWVFFSKNILSTKNLFNLNIVAGGDGSHYKQFEKFAQAHYYSKSPVHTYYMVAHANDNNSKRVMIAKAIDQVLSSLLFLYEQEYLFMDKYKVNAARIMYPVIVFDGELLSALVDKDNVQVSEAKHIQLHIVRQAKTAIDIPWSKEMMRILKSKTFIVDIVQKDYFEEFLKNFD